MEGLIVVFLVVLMFFCAAGAQSERFREHKKNKKKTWIHRADTRPQQCQARGGFWTTEKMFKYPKNTCVSAVETLQMAMNLLEERASGHLSRQSTYVYNGSYPTPHIIWETPSGSPTVSETRKEDRQYVKGSDMPLINHGAEIFNQIVQTPEFASALHAVSTPIHKDNSEVPWPAAKRVILDLARAKYGQESYVALAAPWSMVNGGEITPTELRRQLYEQFAGLPSLAGPPYGDINAPGYTPQQCVEYGGVPNDDGTCTMGIATYGNLSEWGTTTYQ